MNAEEAQAPKYAAHSQTLILDWRYSEDADQMMWQEDFEDRVSDADLAAYLNVLGQQGWEVALGGGTDPATGCGPTRIFLRRLVAVPSEQGPPQFMGADNFSDDESGGIAPRPGRGARIETTLQIKTGRNPEAIRQALDSLPSMGAQTWESSPDQGGL